MSEQSGLPMNWTRACLSEIVDLNPPKVLVAARPDTPISFVPMPAVTEEFGGIDVSHTRPLDEIRKGYTQFVEADVLYAKITPCMENGKIAVVPSLDQGVGYGSTEFHVLRSHHGIEPKWVAHYLSQLAVRRLARRNMTGSAGQLRVPAKWLEEQLLPVAPNSEQRRIVEKIEELFSDLDAGVTTLERAKANLKRYRAAVLKAAVGGSLTAEWRAKHPSVEPASKLLERILVERRRKWEVDQLAKFKSAGKEPPKNWKAKYVEPSVPDTSDLPELPVRWCWTTLDAVSTIIGGYAFQSSHFSSDGIQVVKIANVRAGRLDLSRQPEFIRVVDDDVIHKYSLMRGDILISLTGTRFKRDYGYTAVVNSDERLLLNQRVARIRPFEMDCSNFLQIATTTPQFKDYFFSQETGNVGQGNVGMDSLRNAPLPLCPVSEQHEIAAEVEATMTTIKALENDVLASTKRATRLRQSILKEAFEGKLVSQDPKDEPAGVLLDRIKADAQRHEANGQPKKTKLRKTKQKAS